MGEGNYKKYVDNYPIRNVDKEMYLVQFIKLALNSFDDKKTSPTLSQFHGNYRKSFIFINVFTFLLLGVCLLVVKCVFKFVFIDIHKFVICIHIRSKCLCPSLLIDDSLFVFIRAYATTPAGTFLSNLNVTATG